MSIIQNLITNNRKLLKHVKAPYNIAINQQEN